MAGNKLNKEQKFTLFVLCLVLIIFLVLFFILLLRGFWRDIFGATILILILIAIGSIFIMLIGREDAALLILESFLLFCGFFIFGMVILSLIKLILYGDQDVGNILYFGFLGGIIIFVGSLAFWDPLKRK
jgi:hypothetical protein